MADTPAVFDASAVGRLWRTLSKANSYDIERKEVLTMNNFFRKFPFGELRNWLQTSAQIAEAVIAIINTITGR